MSGMAGLAHNLNRFAGEAGVVCVLHGGEWGTDDLCSCVNHALQCFPAVFSAAPAPHGDAAEHDALNGASVKCAHDGWGGSCLLQFAEEVEALMGFLRQ